MKKILLFIAHLSYIPMFTINNLTMHKVHMYAGAIRKLLYGCVLYSRTYAHSIQYNTCIMALLSFPYKWTMHNFPIPAMKTEPRN